MNILLYNLFHSMANNNKAQKRKIQGWEPSGPISAMLANEFRGKSRGCKTKAFDEMVNAVLGPKYPKLSERYRILKEEGAL